MTKVKSKPPIMFRSRFLSEISTLIVAKSKSIKYHADFSVEHGTDELGEWMRLVYRSLSGPYVIVELTSNQLANVYVRSARSADGGKIMFRLEQIRLPANARRTVDAAIKTFKTADYSYVVHDQLRKFWISIACRVVPDGG